MLVLLFSLFLPMLNVAIGLERRSLPPSLPNGKRGFIATGHNFPHGYEFRQLQPIVTNARNLRNDKHLSYSNVKFLPRESPLIIAGEPTAYNDAFKKSPFYANLPVAVRSAESQGNDRHQVSIHPENLFTMSATYKVDGDGNSKPFNQAAGNIQVPLYRASYPIPKASESQIYAPIFQNKNSPLPILQAQRGQEVPTYWSSVQNQPLLSNPAGHRFDLAARPPNANNAQSSASSLSPRSRFQGQVVPIPTATNSNSHQYSRYKGAFVQVHPNVGAASAVAYQPLQAQPQLHFGHVPAPYVQRADDLRPSTPSQEIRSDVELIDKKKPRLPPKKGDDEDDDDDDNADDQGYGYHRTQYGVNSEVDPRKYFQPPSTESTFKPSASFPFKQYDETFGKYSNRNENQNQDGKAAEKAIAKFHSYATPTVNDKDDEDVAFEKYHTDNSLPKSYYGKQEANREDGREDDRENDRDDDGDGDDEDDGDGEHGYERQRTEESSDNGQASGYLDKDFGEEFERSYRAEAPKQKYVHTKEVAEVEYGTPATRRSKKNEYESEDPSRRRSRTSSNYRKLSKIEEDSEDTEGHSSDILTSLLPHTINEEMFGHKIPQKRF